jgi:hypothetical protein
MSGEYVLCRFYGDGRSLLYVGKTTSLPRRLAQLEREALWWDEVVSSSYERFASMGELDRAKVKAVTTEHPAYNVHMNLHPGKAPGEFERVLAACAAFARYSPGDRL